MRFPREDTPADRLTCVIVNHGAKLRAQRSHPETFDVMEYADVRDALRNPLNVELLQYAIQALEDGRTAFSLKMELAEAKARIK